MREGERRTDPVHCSVCEIRAAQFHHYRLDHDLCLNCAQVLRVDTDTMIWLGQTS